MMKFFKYLIGNKRRLHFRPDGWRIDALLSHRLLRGKPSYKAKLICCQWKPDKQTSLKFDSKEKTPSKKWIDNVDFDKAPMF